MNVVGICRFSMLGRGDWKDYHNQPDEALEEIYARKAEMLFSEQRMEARLATFRHLTLASLAAQTDPDFRLIVISSDRMPEHYQARLSQLCAAVPQVSLRFLPPVHVSIAQMSIMSELGLKLAHCMQFRMDDDDCVSRHFIKRVRTIAQMNAAESMLAVSFSQHYFCVLNGPRRGIYSKYSPFLAAGLAMRHPRKTIFSFGHFAIPRRMYSVADPNFPNLITHRGAGDNDTPGTLGPKTSSADAGEVQSVFREHFNFISQEGLMATGLDHLLSDKLPQAVELNPTIPTNS